MVRRFVTYDGDIQAEEEWELKPTDKCFYCNEYLITIKHTPCPIGFGGHHDYVTLIQGI